ncbi:MAG: hypothetical protein L6Q47_07030 [Ignavibacteriaceae bacterium]|nr:hypothetical protein [Ignavibacteriaceae bacterium]
MNIKSAYITFTGQYILLLFLLQTLPFAQTTIEFQNFTAKGSDTVFAASTKGIYISADQGVTFKKFALDSLDITSLIYLMMRNFLPHRIQTTEFSDHLIMG